MKPNEFVETLSLKNQEIYRGDCPACGNKNTFSVKNMGDAILYNCFHADCEVKGKVKSEISKSSFSNDKKVWNTNSSFAIPSHFAEFTRSNSAVKYLKKYNCMDAIDKKKVSIMYDIKQNRVVFLIKDYADKIIDAIGRSLDKNSKVKWLRYGKSKNPFIVDGEIDKNVVVIVEDCASACAVSCGFSGLALLGTTLTNSTLSVIRNKWSRAIVCLDKDATDKALKMSDRLNFYLQTDIKMLERDLKCEDKDTIYRMFELSKVCSTEYENAGDL